MMILGAVLAAWAGKNFYGTGIAELEASATTSSTASARSC